jgi:redox-sensitive bicupin YhaK (pirin superfamily)
MKNDPQAIRGHPMQTTEIQALPAHVKDIGDGIHIHRYLPHHEFQAIGPFIFFDHMPRLQFEAGRGADVRPHPHIGLSTLSYLLDGRMHHRDSLGCSVILAPGDVLLMTSGKGITHSERTPLADRQNTSQLHMLQFWLALPREHEEMDPAVAQATASQLPGSELQPGLHARVAIGEFNGLRSPVSTHGEPLLLDLRGDTAGSWQLNATDAELALFLLDGQLVVNGQSYSEPTLLRLPRSENIDIRYSAGSRFMLFGGQPMDGPRHLWWNLVASDQALIEAAKLRWKQGEFPLVPEDEEEFIPLPA